MKQRALQQGQPFKDLVADYILQGLHPPAASPAWGPSGVLAVDGDGLPLFRPDPNVTTQPLSLAEALALEQETLSQEDRRRAGLPY